MEELLLRSLSAREELDIVEDQHVDLAEAPSEALDAKTAIGMPAESTDPTRDVFSVAPV